jgi:isoleucyl-tRNA synthetase
MDAARRVVALGRAVRNAEAIKTRQPLREVVIVPTSESSNMPQWLQGEDLHRSVNSLRDIVLDELNVKDLRFGSLEDVFEYELKPNFAAIGPKYGRLAPKIAQALSTVPPEARVGAAARGENVQLDVEGQEITLTPSDLFVVMRAQPGYATFPGGNEYFSLALSTDLDAELVDEGLVRELVHGIQNLRRDGGFEIEETVSLSVDGSERLVSLLRGPWGDYVKSEVLARDLRLADGGVSPDSAANTLSVDGEELRVSLRKG